MNENSIPVPYRPSLVIRWAARLTGVFLISMLAMFVIGHQGLPNIFQQPGPVQLEFLAMFLMVVGFLAGWRWEAVGGVVALGGFALFVLTEIATNGQFPGGAIPLFAIPGILLIASHWVSKCGAARFR